MEKRELDPWRVIFSFLSDLSSDQVLQIIGRTGLSVDWVLNGKESFSHTTRLRAYLPRIIQAYDQLVDESKLRVAWIVAKEIALLGQDHSQKLNYALKSIGWKIESNKMEPDNEKVRELFFPKGAIHDAYVEIKSVLCRAKKVVYVMDPYVDASIFQMIKAIPSVTLSVKLLSTKVPPDFKLEAEKFLKQHSNIILETRMTKEFHDRFIIIDETECYHLGASIKDAGGKAFMISLLEDSRNVTALLSQHKESWDRATIL